MSQGPKLYAHKPTKKVRLLLQTPRKEKIDVEEEVTTAFSAVAQTTSTAQRSVKLREPISEDQQRDALKWILEEKGKVKPKDREEKKRIDEEKALQKQLIRAKSLPRI